MGRAAGANLHSRIKTAKASVREPGACMREIFTRRPAIGSIYDIEALLPFSIAMDHDRE